MRHAIAISGSHFNTQRMLQPYVSNAYLRRGARCNLHYGVNCFQG
jgi:hypothetical protein